MRRERKREKGIRRLERKEETERNKDERMNGKSFPVYAVKAYGEWRYSSTYS